MKDELAGLQMQIDRLNDELRSAQKNIRSLEKKTKWRPNIFTLACLALLAVFGFSSFGTRASSENEKAPSISLADVPTKVKAPFEVVDDSGRTIMRVQDNDPAAAGLGRGAYVFDPSNKPVVEITSSTLGGGRVRVRSGSHQDKFMQMVSVDNLFGIQMRSDGKDMASIGQFDGKDPVIQLDNATGKPAAALTSNGNDGLVNVYGSSDKPAATLKSDTGEGKLWINNTSGKAVVGVFSTDNGGVVKVMKNADPTTYTSISAINAGMGLAVRVAGARKSFVGTNEEGNGSVFIYASGDDPVAGLSTTSGRGIVEAISHGIAIAFLTESDKHPGGGNFTATNPGGEGIFSAGFTGDGGEACVNRKVGLKCLGIALPLQINE